MELVYLPELFLERAILNKSVNKIVHDLSNDRTKQYVEQSTFKIAIGLHDMQKLSTTNAIFDETYFGIDIGMIHTNWQSNTTPSYINLNHTSCTKDDFANIDQAIFNRIHMSNYICIDSDYYLLSDLQGDISSVLSIYINVCQNDTNSNVTCKSTEEIKNVLNHNFLNIAYTSAFFDFDDYDTPVKTYLNDFDQMSLNLTFYQFYNLRLHHNQAVLYDDLIITSSSETHKYFSVSKANYRIFNQEYNPERLAQVLVRLARESEHYERVVYSFFDMFGYLGGLFDFLYFIGYI